jgi:predicted nucleotidyltransferase component of viral defense system
MIKQVLEEKIKEYSIASVIDQENVLQELVQQYVLASLSRAGFFSHGQAVFHGGTCLRIVYGMSRFSEDLDFFLKRPDPDFRWQKYLDVITRDGAGEGFHFDVLDKPKRETPVKKTFLRTDSIGRVLLLELPFDRDTRKLINVKLEIDTNPPMGSGYETRYVTFPVTASMTTQTLESGFGMKLSALLARGYAKGRDWYDFIWYTNKKIVPDLDLLRNALDQHGPWAGHSLDVDPDWVLESMKRRITELDWDAARQDVQRFLPLREQESLKLWKQDFFLHYLDIFAQYLVR